MEVMLPAPLRGTIRALGYKMQNSSLDNPEKEIASSTRICEAASQSTEHAHRWCPRSHNPRGARAGQIRSAAGWRSVYPVVETQDSIHY
ncbi:hypothetical protein PG984_003019 [Apiospora sp. TS-2023a]